MCVPFGLRVIGVDARRADCREGVAEMHRPEALDHLLPRADFVILTIPHTPETEGLMNAARFSRMKRSAFFINIGRGKTTRLDDLVDALAFRPDRGRSAGCVGGRAAIRQPPAVKGPQRAVDAAHRRLRSIP